MDIQEIIAETEPFISHDITQKRFNTLMLSGISFSILLYPFLVITLLPTITDYTWRIFLSRIIIWGVMGCLYIYAQKGEVQNMLLWRETNYKASFYFKWLFFLYLLTMVVGSVAKIPFWLGVHENNAVAIKLMQIMQKQPLLLIFSAATAGVTEEFIYRGYVLSRLSLIFNNKHVAVIISAVLFAIIHLGYRTYNELIFAFGIGVVFGYHYQKYRSLTILMITHFLIDLIAMNFFKAH